MKLKLIIATALIAVSANSYAAIFVVSNVVAGTALTDALFQNTSTPGVVGNSGATGTLMNGGIVTLGYFATNAFVPSSNLNSIGTTIAGFTVVATGIPGTSSDDLGGSFAGFVQSEAFPGGQITGVNALIGRTLYVFAGNNTSLALSTAWGLKAVNTIVDDVPNETTYLANPLGGAAPVIGTIGSFIGNPGLQGAGTFNTLQLAAIPEPSTALLGAIGALGLLRRRRN